MKGRTLEEPGKPPEGTAVLTPVEEEGKGGRAGRKGLTLQHSSRRSWVCLKRVCKLKSPMRRVLPSQEQPCQEQAPYKHKGGLGRHQWDHPPIMFPTLDPSGAFSWPSPYHILLFQIYHISNLPTIVERPMCMQRTTLSVMGKKNTKDKKFTKFWAEERSLQNCWQMDNAMISDFSWQLFARFSEHLKNSLPDFVPSPLTLWTTEQRVCIMLILWWLCSGLLSSAV